MDPTNSATSPVSSSTNLSRDNLLKAIQDKKPTFYNSAPGVLSTTAAAMAVGTILAAVPGVINFAWNSDIPGMVTRTAQTFIPADPAQTLTIIIFFTAIGLGSSLVDVYKANQKAKLATEVLEKNIEPTVSEDTIAKMDPSLMASVFLGAEKSAKQQDQPSTNKSWFPKLI